MTLHKINLSDLMSEAHSHLITSLDYAARLSLHAASAQASLVDDPATPFLLRVSSGHSDVARLARETFAVEVSRYALIFIAAHWERYLLELRFLRSLVEEQVRSGGATPVEDHVAQRERVMKDVRRVSVDRQLMELAGQDDAIAAGGEWFRGLYAMRLCLVHRAGIVGQDDPRLTDGIVWRHMALTLDGKEVPENESSPKFEKGQTIQVTFVDRKRSWPLGAHVTLTPKEVQEMAYSMLEFADMVHDHVHARLANALGEAKNDANG